MAVGRASLAGAILGGVFSISAAAVISLVNGDGIAEAKRQKQVEQANIEASENQKTAQEAGSADQSPAAADEGAQAAETNTALLPAESKEAIGEGADQPTTEQEQAPTNEAPSDLPVAEPMKLAATEEAPKLPDQGNIATDPERTAGAAPNPSLPDEAPKADTQEAAPVDEVAIAEPQVNEAPQPEQTADPATAPAKPVVIKELPKSNSLISEDKTLAGKPATPLVSKVKTINRTEEMTTSAESTDAQTPFVLNASTAEVDTSKPLLAVVLYDRGDDNFDSGILGSLPFPITIAVSAERSDAAERAKKYRDKGFEVLMWTPLPDGAQPSDVEVAFSQYLSSFEGAIGITDGPNAGYQSSREITTQAVDIAAKQGYGMVFFAKGLGSAEGIAQKVGVPSGTVGRVFDTGDRDEQAMRRFLDDAATKAKPDRGVIVSGYLRNEALEALLLWGVQRKAERVSLAPASRLMSN